jgi:hypothetical protein
VRLRIARASHAALIVALLLAPACSERPAASADNAGVARVGSPPEGFDPRNSFAYLEQICAIGPRISGTQGMLRQQEIIEEHFVALGADVKYQEFDAAHPETGAPVRMRNMIVSWHPESKQRVLLCCHYDTRPRPDREPWPPNREKPFIGANDGGSGVALFMEMGRHMHNLKPTHGVDFVFFDGEELIYDPQRDANRYFLGSTHYAQQYRDNPPDHRYECGVLVDMIGGKDFKAYYESNSLKYAPELTQSVWAKAREIGVREFIPRRKHEVRDDHLPLNEIARIPTCDIIDFDFPYWHLRNDIPAVCSGDSMAKVARVLFAWLEDVPKVPAVRGVR